MRLGAELSSQGSYHPPRIVSRSHSRENSAPTFGILLVATNNPVLFANGNGAENFRIEPWKMEQKRRRKQTHPSQHMIHAPLSPFCSREAGCAAQNMEQAPCSSCCEGRTGRHEPSSFRKWLCPQRYFVVSFCHPIGSPAAARPSLSYWPIRKGPSQLRFRNCRSCPMMEIVTANLQQPGCTLKDSNGFRQARPESVPHDCLLPLRLETTFAKPSSRWTKPGNVR